MNTRALGIVGALSSPFLLIGLISNGFIANASSQFSSVCNLIYMTGWMCSIIALWTMQATGKNGWGKAILVIQLVLLAVANSSNVYEILYPSGYTHFYQIAETFWPISNAFMIVTGIAVASTEAFKGWKRFVVLIAGLWVYIFVAIIFITTRTAAVLISAGVYSAIAWFLLGASIYLSASKAYKEEAYSQLSTIAA